MKIDRMLLEKDANTVITNEILGSIIVPEARPKDPCGYCGGAGEVTEGQCSDCQGTGFLWAHWPGLERPLQERYEWWKQRSILKDPDDRYTYYWAVAKQCRPTLIAECGVFYGYSLMAMAQGTIAGGMPRDQIAVNGFDNESYAAGCLEWARQGFMEERISCNLMHVDSQQIPAFPLHMIQLASIDGDHSYDSAMNDLVKMEVCMVPRPRLDAVYILDDVGWALNVRKAGEDFAEKYGYDVMHIPTHKGTGILTRK